MEQYYTDERNVQILIALMKEHGIKRVIASPGSTNVTFVGSIQQDPYFEIYSCVDERSAAYMACGMAAETCEPVALSCTGATASRNYFPALTEAFYRKLPILAITSTQEEAKVGHMIPQILDRNEQPRDTVKMSVHLQTVKDELDEWDVMVKANMAILELNHHGIGPVHVNLTTRYSKNFTVKELKPVHKIERFCLQDQWPNLPKCKIAIYVGSHLRWSDRLTRAVDKFCASHGAVIFCDPTANYTGKYRVNHELVSSQRKPNSLSQVDLLIHIGNMSDMFGMVRPKNVWRVAEDGLIADPYTTLNKVFEMPEELFFEHYATDATINDEFLDACHNAYDEVYREIPEIPFSHLWVASQLFDKLPQNSTMHLGILSPLRSWSYFNFSPTIEFYCNQGGFGIDGNMSSMIGASLVNPQRIFFAAVGDLSFFYDMNSLGNRHIGPNVRILLVNNALGAEFHLFKQRNSTHVNNIEKYLSAGGHFGQKSPDLVRHYATDLGFEYLSASSKEEFEKVYERFVTPEITNKPMVLEVFTRVEDENQALYSLWHIQKDKSLKTLVKKGVKDVIGEEMTQKVKKIIKK